MGDDYDDVSNCCIFDCTCALCVAIWHYFSVLKVSA